VRAEVRGEYGFSSLMKQNKKGKNCAVFCFAGKRKLVFYILRCDCEAKNLKTLHYSLLVTQGVTLGVGGLCKDGKMGSGCYKFRVEGAGKCAQVGREEEGTSSNRPDIGRGCTNIAVVSSSQRRHPPVV
jgi:hypothetical protein